MNRFYYLKIEIANIYFNMHYMKKSQCVKNLRYHCLGIKAKYRYYKYLRF